MECRQSGSKRLSIFYPATIWRLQQGRNWWSEVEDFLKCFTFVP
jgi:hypothetical protein